MNAKKYIWPMAFISIAIGMSACSDSDDLTPSEVPANVRTEFIKMYPRANDVEWEIDNGYYVADFNVATFDTEAWYTPAGTWSMTVTDYGSLVNNLPIVVANAFNQSEYAAWIVDDAKYYERPINSFCMIEVETNGFPEIALFYDTFGNLINKVQGDDFNITPDTQVEAITYGW